MLARDPALPYWYASGLLVLAIVSLLAIRHRAPPAAAKEPPLKQMAEGARFVWHERFLLGCVTLDLFAVLLGGATAMLPAFAYDVLHVGDEGLGLMRAARALSSRRSTSLTASVSTSMSTGRTSISSAPACHANNDWRGWSLMTMTGRSRTSASE